MPFTISHIAAAVPFAKPLRRAGLWSAAVIGTMAPDMGLIWPWQSKLTRADTHGWAALFTFALPVGFLAWTLFQALVKPALLEILPDSWYGKIQGTESMAALMSPRQWLLAATAILFGAISHLLWDGLTHEDGVWVSMLPFLIKYGPSIAGHTLYWFQIMQHLSTLVGLSVVIWATCRWVRAANRDYPRLVRQLSPVERSLWALLYLAIPASFVLAGTVRIYWEGTVGILSIEALSYLAVLGMLSSTIALLGVSALLRTRLSIFIGSAQAA
jgi:hypothetical protein